MARAVAITEGRADPYWSDPAEEGPRFARIYEAIRGTGNKNITGRDFGYAGVAAYGVDPNNIVLIVAKHNDNAVLFLYSRDKTGVHIKPCWLSLEPSSRAEHLAKGNPSLFDGLNAAEEMGYGVTLETIADGKGGVRYLANLNAEPLRHLRFELLLEKSGAPFLGGMLAGKKVRALQGYIQMRRGLTALSALGAHAVEHIKIYGTDIAAGTMVEEIIRP